MNGWRKNLALIVAGWTIGLHIHAAPLPEWTRQIRSDHPRLFFNRDTWPKVRERATGAERDWYRKVRAEVDRLLAAEGRATSGSRDLGVEAAKAAFIFLMTEDARYLGLAKRSLANSIAFYEACYQQRKTVDWYSTSRVHAIMAWDWLYNHLSETERKEYLSRLVRVLDLVIKAKPPIYRENLSGYDTGFYGVRNCLWFLACTGLGTGIETEKVNEWLVWGRNENLKMLEHRRKACGDDGGGASSTLGYVLGAYPWAEQNFFYTWLSATGENMAPNWPHSALLFNYVLWNWIESPEGPLEFGYGDTLHTSNRLPTGELYTHAGNVRHLFGKHDPQAAGLARAIQERLPHKTYSSSWFIYPFLWTELESSPPAFWPQRLPKARNFETMGQIFMRSGTGPNDTYCLFTCGGILRQHRHYDALNFVIYHRGFLALDSGTRYDQFANGAHLANYYAQTVAHNCALIHQPGEPPAPYWGGKVIANHGGQHRQLGSVVRAFETHDDYVYVAGDATACYQHGKTKTDKGEPLTEKTTQVTRQLVFIPPHHFVIFDRVNSTDPSYRKEWLLHTAWQPTIQGRTVRADHGQGRMFCQTVLPDDAQLAAVGGSGKEFWAAGKNWALAPNNLTADERALMGQWRVEVAPGAPRRDDLFLHVIQVGAKDLAAMDAIHRIETGGQIGVRVQIGSDTWQILFNTQGPLGGRIARTGPQRKLEAEFTDRVQRQTGILATE